MPQVFCPRPLRRLPHIRPIALPPRTQPSSAYVRFCFHSSSSVPPLVDPWFCASPSIAYAVPTFKSLGMWDCYGLQSVHSVHSARGKERGGIGVTLRSRRYEMTKHPRSVPLERPHAPAGGIPVPFADHTEESHGLRGGRRTSCRPRLQGQNRGRLSAYAERRPSPSEWDKRR